MLDKVEILDTVEIQDAAALKIITIVAVETQEIMVYLVAQEIVVEDIYSYQLSYSYVMVTLDVEILDMEIQVAETMDTEITYQVALA